MPSSAHRSSRPPSRVLGVPLVILALVLLGMALALPAGAYVSTSVGGWYWQDLSAPATLNGVAFGDASHGWAVGGTIAGKAAVHATADGGVTWSDQATGDVPAVLEAVTAADATHAWAVGTGGHILATADGGATWHSQLSGTTHELTAVVFADATHGWAVGRGGVILATTNGTTWAPQVSGTGTDLSGVDFADAAHGWAVGAGGVMLVTTNGGSSWSPQASHVADDFTGVAFTDATHGWAVTFGGSVDSTTDGGLTWSVRRIGTGSVHPSAVAFADAAHGWAVGGTEDEPWGARIWATANGGATWTLQASAGGPEAGVNAVALSDATHGWAVGDGSILATDTGGRSPLTLKLSGLAGSSLTLGKKLKANGTALPASLAGGKVTLSLQRKSGSRWVKVKTSGPTIAAGGAYGWTYKPAARGSYRMRAAIARYLARPPMATMWAPFKVK